MSQLYQLTSGTSILRTSDGASIPNDPNNTDYANYLVWCKTNTPDPITPISLSQSQINQSILVTNSYLSAIAIPVNFTSANGISKTYQADSNSQNVLLQAVTGYNISGSVPVGFWWKSSDNTEVAFVLADLKGLYAAMLSQGWVAFQHLQSLKTQILSATTTSAVSAIIW